MASVTSRGMSYRAPGVHPEEGSNERKTGWGPSEPSRQSSLVVDAQAAALEKARSAQISPKSKAKIIPLFVPRADPATGAERSLAWRIFVTLEQPAASKVGKWISTVVMILIMISTATYVLGTMPHFQYTPEVGAAECEAELVCGEVDEAWALTHLNQSSNLDVVGELGECELRESDGEFTRRCDYCKCFPVQVELFTIIEAICIIAFTVEYLARMFTVFAVSPAMCGLRPEYGTPEAYEMLTEADSFIAEALEDGTTSEIKSAKRFKERLFRPLGAWEQTYIYGTTTMNLVDVVAILPFYAGLLDFGGGGLGFVRVLRLARVFRIFKLGKFNEGMRLFSRTLQASMPALSLLIFFNVISVVLFGSIIYFIEGGQFKITDDYPAGAFFRKNSFNDAGDSPQVVTPFESIPQSFYWVFVTTTTVGYGDMYPITTLGKIIAIMCMHMGILVIALPITVIGSNFTREYAMLHSDGSNAEEDAIGEVLDEVLGTHPDDSSAVHRGNVGSSSIGSEALRKLRQSGSLKFTNAGTKGGGNEAAKLLAMAAVLKHGSGPRAAPGECTDAASTLANIKRQMRTLTATMETLENYMAKGPSNNGRANDSDFTPITSVSPDADRLAGDMVMPVKRGRVGRSSVPSASAGGSAAVSGAGGISMDTASLFSAAAMPSSTKTKKASTRVAPAATASVADGLVQDLETESATQALLRRRPAAAPAEEAATSESKATAAPPPAPADAPKSGTSAETISKLRRARQSSFKQISKSVRWGQPLWQSTKGAGRNLANLGETSRPLRVTVCVASGLPAKCQTGTGHDEVSVTVTCGSQTYTTPARRLGNDVMWGETFEYQVPVSTHSGKLMLRHVEAIVHAGAQLLGTAVMRLDDVDGQAREYRLHNRRSAASLADPTKARLAGKGRLKLRLEWAQPTGSKAAHKYGTSFSRMLSGGDNWCSPTAEGVPLFREGPVYPSMLPMAPTRPSVTFNAEDMEEFLDLQGGSETYDKAARQAHGAVASSSPKVSAEDDEKETAMSSSPRTATVQAPAESKTMRCEGSKARSPIMQFMPGGGHNMWSTDL